jgi:hypothetical protein
MTQENAPEGRGKATHGLRHCLVKVCGVAVAAARGSLLLAVRGERLGDCTSETLVMSRRFSLKEYGSHRP